MASKKAENFSTNNNNLDQTQSQKCILQFPFPNQIYSCIGANRTGFLAELLAYFEKAGKITKSPSIFLGVLLINYYII